MLTDLKNCKTIYDLSALLSIQPKHLTYLIYILPSQHRYSAKCISKKNGNTRHIMVPNLGLKALQRKLSGVLYECQSDIDSAKGSRRSFGFEQGRTIYDNAAQHIGKKWVFNVDIQEFFPSINFGRVIGYFKNNSNFQLEDRIATLIAQIACHDNQLPQGAPSSPVISNLIAGSLDYRLSRLARKSRCSYSRYVDDITFSTNQREFPDQLAVQVRAPQGWVASDELISRIQSAGFELNSQKTRMAYRRSRQIVTGLTVNKKPSVPRPKYKRQRAAVHNIMRGKDWFLPRFDSSFAWNCESEPTAVDEFAALEGQLSFAHYIATRSDPRPLNNQFFSPRSVSRTYADILYFKYFVRGSKPIILTEGVSDILYIKAALLSAKTDIEHLVAVDPINDNEILVDFFNFPETAGRVMALTGGTGPLGVFFERYSRFLRKLSTNVARRPFITLLDNDDGLDGTQKSIQSSFGTKIARPSNNAFYKLSKATYVVKTPHKGAKQKTSCEDFLDQKAKGVVLDGKTFSPSKDYDKSKHFGKFILGSHILSNRDSYSHVNFSPILERLRLAIEEAHS